MHVQFWKINLLTYSVVHYLARISLLAVWNDMHFVWFSMWDWFSHHSSPIPIRVSWSRRLGFLWDSERSGGKSSRILYTSTHVNHAKYTPRKLNFSHNCSQHWGKSEVCQKSYTFYKMDITCFYICWWYHNIWLGIIEQLGMLSHELHFCRLIVSLPVSWGYLGYLCYFYVIGFSNI